MSETYTVHTGLTLLLLAGWGALTAIGAYAVDRIQKKIAEGQARR